MIIKENLIEILKDLNKNGIHYSTNFYNTKLKERIYSSLIQKLWNIELIEWIHYEIKEVWDLYVNDQFIKKSNDKIEKTFKDKKIGKDEVIQKFIKWVDKGSENRYSRILIVTNNEDIKTLIKWEFEFNENWFFKWKRSNDIWYNTIGGFYTFYEVVSTVTANEIETNIKNDIEKNSEKSFYIQRNVKDEQVKEKKIRIPKNKNNLNKFVSTENIECNIWVIDETEQKDQELVSIKEFEKMKTSDSWYMSKSSITSFHKNIWNWYSKTFILQ